MTDTTFASPRLERPRDSAFKGVCAALARTTGTDVVLWRVLVVVLCFFAGLGLFLYLAGIAVIPAEGEPRSLADRVVHGPDRRLTGWQVLLLALVLLTFGGLVSDSNGVLIVIVLATLGLIWWRGRTDRIPAATPDLSGVAVPVVGAVGGAVPVAGAVGGAVPMAGDPDASAPAWNPSPPRPRSPLGGVTVGAAVLVAGILLLVGATGAATVSAEAVLAAALGVVGLGLIVGSWWGRSGGLVLLALLLAAALGGTVAVRPALEAGVGERTWVPVGSASYRLGVGDATLDLRSVTVREEATVGIDARVEVGHLLVLLPEGVRIALDARADLGDVNLLGQETNGRQVSEHLELGPAGRPQLRLDLRVRTGQVEVRRG